VTYPEPAQRGFPSPLWDGLREPWVSSPGGFGAQSLGYQQVREPQGSPPGGFRVAVNLLPKADTARKIARYKQAGS
jgi:hypothetical protein